APVAELRGSPPGRGSAPPTATAASTAADDRIAKRRRRSKRRARELIAPTSGAPCCADVRRTSNGSLICVSLAPRTALRSRSFLELRPQSFACREEQRLDRTRRAFHRRAALGHRKTEDVMERNRRALPRGK